MECSGVPFDEAQIQKTLFEALLDARDRFGSKKIILEDHERKPYSYNRMLLACMIMGNKLASFTNPQERVGLFVPSSTASAIVFFSLNAIGRVPSMLNFTAGVRNLLSCCETTQIRTIITSRRFVDQGRMGDVLDTLAIGRRVLYLEDIAASLSSWDKLKGVLNLYRARFVHKKYRVKPEDGAAIVFTSGSDGNPKGVVLSNKNLLANSYQLKQHAGDEFRLTDVMFNTLPIFHAFGLSVGFLLGILNGMKVVLYPSPLHYKQIPKLMGAVGATFLFSTDTFLQGYVKTASQDDMKTLRYIVAGAEKVKPSTRQAWQSHNVIILEGYGASECSPVIAVNTPQKYLDGTVGTLLPGVQAQMIPVDGIHEGGKFLVKGPNVMKGYVDSDDVTHVFAPKDGWHDTGDIVAIDREGFVSVKGRAKRFAKIGGEMVPLAAVEAMAQSVWPDAMNAAVALPDRQKGEQIIVLTTCIGADRDDLLQFSKKEGFPELWVPKGVLVIEAIPVMGMGKIDYVNAKILAENMYAMMV